MSIGEFIGWLLASGGVGYICSRVLEWFDNYWAWFGLMRPDLKRLTAFGMTAVLAATVGTLAILLQAWLGYEGIPETAQNWVERLFVIASTAIISSQVTHASRVETARRQAEDEARWRAVMGE